MIFVPSKKALKIGQYELLIAKFKVKRHEIETAMLEEFSMVGYSQGILDSISHCMYEIKMVDEQIKALRDLQEKLKDEN